SFYFGTAMAAIDDRFLVGDPGDYSGATPGAVHLVDARTGEILRTILAPDPQTYGDGTFGQTVARRATDIVVGAPGQLVGGVAAAGVVYVFEAATGALRLTISDPAPAPDGLFGSALAANETDILIGASGHGHA